jgi:hypothetical protein
MPGLGLSIPDVAARGRAALDPAAAALIARMSVSPSDARVALIDTLVRALKGAGVWARLDLLYVLAAHDAQAARLNWVQSAYALSAVNSPGFTADRGYAGNGTTSYLDTGFQAGVTSGLAALNDNHLGLWSLTDLNAVQVDAGSSNFYLRTRQSGSLLARNMVAGDTITTVASSLGHTMMSRSASSGYPVYRDGTSLGTGNAASSAASAANLLIGARGSASSADLYGSRRIAVAHCGASLSAGQAAALYAALSAYLTAVGAV